MLDLKMNVLLLTLHRRNLCWGILIFMCIFFFTDGVAFYKSDFTDFLAAFNAILSFIIGTTLFYFLINKSEMTFNTIIRFMIKHQEEVARNEFLNFFINQAKLAGVGAEFTEYLHLLGRPPLIKECMSKLMDLTNINVNMDA